jgi:hypothetical protein
MDALNQAEVREFLLKADIAAGDRELDIGRELHYHRSPRRTVVIHFSVSDSLDYISQIVSIVLSAQDSWLLIPRYAPASKLAVSSGFPVADALRFGAGDREQLCGYLCTRDMGPGAVSSDLYIVGGNGHIIVTWDHHTRDEGLSIDLRDVSESSKLLAGLNDLGAEMEVFYTDG